MFLVKHGVNLDSQNKKGNTPLLIALMNNNVEIARYLILEGADKNIANIKS